MASSARRQDRLAKAETFLQAAGRRPVAVRTDVTKPEDCKALAKAAVDSFGRVDILVNNAGVGTAVPASRETPEQFRSVIDLNLNGCYWMAQACAADMPAVLPRTLAGRLGRAEELSAALIFLASDASS